MDNDIRGISNPATPLRFGMVNRIRPEALDSYLALHADGHPGVRDLLVRYHICNFNIFLQRIGEEWFEFAYYEYTGSDHAADMAALAAEPRNIQWLANCDPMQQPLEGQTGWTVMERIYFNP
ncbi:MAG: L-rhamnose mutarotase [bacterium]